MLGLFKLVPPSSRFNRLTSPALFLLRIPMLHIDSELALQPYSALIDAPAVMTTPTLCCAECGKPIVGEEPSRVNVGSVQYTVMAIVHHACELPAIRSAISRLHGVRT